MCVFWGVFAFNLRKLYDSRYFPELIDCLHPERIGERRVAFCVFHPGSVLPDDIHDVTHTTDGVKVF